MEKESDLDDILNYRSAAEFEIQEYLSRYSTPNNGRSHTDISAEKSGNDENNVKSRGWLNWLSRGMLGAGVAFGDVWLYTMVTGTVLGNNGWRKGLLAEMAKNKWK
ncbi:vacuolar protein sorting-associated protein [Trifolium medium]|uniref:Vacuolar protein sorting-associated protein n=1 Tax=Trifolium medium TaxID=97028 RepID=A0A392M9Z0_9FABA|nr:vacuolar protein sorting-associated protein [Trifolium medium]